MKLPLQFLDRMKNMLGDIEYEDFLKSYNLPRYYGLRINTLKADVDTFLSLSPFKLDMVPWTSDGFYYEEGAGPGKHPFYHAGLYYIQEPSAMLPGAILGAVPGEKVLDLCAAPGGKTVQIAASMKGKGLLVANDISSERIKALIKNIELCGIRNAIVTNETPEKLAAKFAGYFDRIIIDAPCSGEGMFRKDEEAARSWEKFKCEKCVGMQNEILKSVDIMLKPGGCIVYSTCTFAPEEDELMISSFLDKHNNYELIEIPKLAGIQEGRPEWANGRSDLKLTARLWPHKLKGEGHFVAKLCKRDNAISFQNTENNSETNIVPNTLLKFNKSYKSNMPEKAKTAKTENLVLEGYKNFEAENLNMSIDGVFLEKGNNLYNLPEAPPDLSGIKVSKFGWYLGELAGRRFEPSHSMITALCEKDLKRSISFEPDSRDIFSYLKGETLMLDGEKGYTGVCVSGYTIGWAKQMGGMLKNLYPKGWRKMH